VTQLFEITRKLEIDMGHRVPSHGGKCRNMHGHRYVIEATFAGKLKGSGSEEGMVTDFGAIKALMIDVIEDHFDHKFAWHREDPYINPEPGVQPIVQPLGDESFVYLVDVPTAENLARMWFFDLDSQLEAYAGGGVWLKRVRVYETPNCWADFAYDMGE
jgi:6-pyruvoyltetrahydropterin/6-carboxytetrahydropterin synthase